MIAIVLTRLAMLAAAVSAGRPSPAALLPTDGATTDESSQDRRAAPDSAETLHRAMAEQIRFEQTRRQHLPRIFGTSVRCDERIGRYCFSFTDDDSWQEKEEPAPVRAARERLIGVLDSSASVVPTDAWIAGQRVRYLLEAKRYPAALQASSDCRAEPWWCHALAGYALHVAQRFVDAGRAFAEALATMPQALRCEWTDLSRLLDGGLRGRYNRLPCAQRDSLQQRVLWLADPLYSVPGNELLTEHLSRHVFSELLRRAESVEGDRWRNDLHRIIVRYGWPVAWQRVIGRSVQPGTTDIISHYGRGGRYFLPTDRFLDDPAGIAPDSWELDPHRPRAEHSPRYALSDFDAIERHYLTIFRRGETAVIVATYDWQNDSLPPNVETTAAMWLARDEHSAAYHAQHHQTGAAGVLALRVPSERYLLSLEVITTQQDRASRARFGVDLSPPPRGPTLSGLLLLRTVDILPASLEEAIPMANPTSTAAPGDRLGLYWEVTDVGGHLAPLSTSLVLIRRSRGFFRRIAELTPFASNDPPVSLSWQDLKPAGPMMFPRAVSVDLPEDLSNGRYELRLQISLEDGRTLTSSRAIVVSGR